MSAPAVANPQSSLLCTCIAISSLTIISRGDPADAIEDAEPEPSTALGTSG